MLNTDKPDTVKAELHVNALFNIVLPDTNNVETNVDAPETNKLVKLVLLNNVVDVAFKLLIDKIEDVDKLFKLVFVAYIVKFGGFKILL